MYGRIHPGLRLYPESQVRTQGLRDPRKLRLQPVRGPIRDRAPTEEWRKDFCIAWPETGKPDYELKDDIDEATLQHALNSTKYGSVYQKLDTFDLVKVLRYAKMAGTYLAAKVKDPAKRAEKEREIVFSVHALHLARAPLNVDIQEQGADSMLPLQLSFIQEIKVLQKNG